MTRHQDAAAHLRPGRSYRWPDHRPRIWVMPHALPTCALLIYFAVRLCFFAVKISPEVPPDEFARVGLTVAFSKVAGIPSDGPETYHLGAIEGQPYLYYLVMGKLLHLNVLPVSDLVFLRLLNALLGLGTVVYALRWIDLFEVSAWTRTLFVVISTNVLMFTSLSAAVSYDNLANLLAAACFFHLFRWFQARSASDLLWLFGALLAGCLTKKTFLPLAAIFGLVLLLWQVRQGREALGALRAWRPHGRGAMAGLVAVSLLGAANLWLYGGNLVAHQRLVPTMIQVVGSQNAMRHRLVARDRILAAYRERQISFARANALAKQITHKTDREATRALLRITRRTGDRRMGLPAYLATWTRHMVKRTFGYSGHRGMPPGTARSAVYFALLAGAAVVFSLRRRAAAVKPGIGLAAVIAAAYTAVLLFGVNYPSYVETGIPGLAVQGRYIFPVFVPLCGLVAVAWTDFVPRAVRTVATPAIAIFFLYGDLPFFLSRAGPAWFTAG